MKMSSFTIISALYLPLRTASFFAYRSSSFGANRQASPPRRRFFATLQSEAIDQKRHVDQHTAFSQLSPDLVQRATDVLTPYINTERLTRIESVLKKRTAHCRFLFENPSNPSNVGACLRTIESFGIQYVNVVIGSQTGSTAIGQKKLGTKTASGTAKWLTLNSYSSTTEAVASIKNQGYSIYAYDHLNYSNSKDIRGVDWKGAGPICICMGNEECGISEELRRHANVTFTLPMVGLAESFNLSVATAITLAHVSSAAASEEHTSEGGRSMWPGKMGVHEENCLRLKWLLNSLPQQKMGKALLVREGVELPKAINLL